VVSGKRVDNPGGVILCKVFETDGLGLDFSCKVFILLMEMCKVLI